MKELLNKKLGIIDYYNENKNFPMFEDLFLNKYNNDNLTFIEYINNYFKKFIKEESISYSVENFITFEIIYYEELIQIFNKYKIDYDLIKEIKKQLF